MREQRGSDDSCSARRVRFNAKLMNERVLTVFSPKHSQCDEKSRLVKQAVC